MGEKKKVLLFSVTAEDCEWQTFRAGGKGGQHQNKTETGVRCIHRASGAVGEARDSRSQIENKRAAFQRMIESEAFQSWHRLEAARRMANERSIEAMVEKAVDQAMNPANLNVEVQDGRGRWIPESQSSET